MIDDSPRSSSRLGIVKDLQALSLGMMPLGGIESPLTGLQNPLEGQAELVLKKGLREIPRRHRAPDVLQGFYREVYPDMKITGIWNCAQMC